MLDQAAGNREWGVPNPGLWLLRYKKMDGETTHPVKIPISLLSKRDLGEDTVMYPTVKLSIRSEAISTEFMMIPQAASPTRTLPWPFPAHEAKMKMASFPRFDVMDMSVKPLEYAWQNPRTGEIRYMI